jgi:hypothetical protein
MRFSLDENRFESPLEEMAGPLVPPVEALSVLSIQTVHPTGEPPDRRFEEQVIVVPQQAISVELEHLLDDHGAQKIEEIRAIDIVEEDGRSFITPADHMVEGSRKFEA